MKVVALLLIFLAVPAMAEDPAAATTLPAETPAAADGSIYDLESMWKDQNGGEHALKDMGDRVRVVVMGYSTCQFACTRLIADLVSIESEVAKVDGLASEVGYAFISIDPDNDTPEQLKTLESQYKFTDGAWMLLTGDEDGVLGLAVALGMKYRKTSPGDFAHSNIITVLRRDGSIAHQQVGLGAERTATIDAIRDAAS